MTIETVNNYYQLGGAETVARQLHEGALSAGYDSRFHVAEGSRWPNARGLRPLYPRILARLHESRFRSFVDSYAPRRRWTDRSFRALARGSADLVHVHSYHGSYASLESFAVVAQAKPLVWTFHRFWGITGGCDHPFGCERYQLGCGHCPQIGRFAVGSVDRTAEQWTKKRRILSDLPITVVSPSQHLAKRVRESELGRKWVVEVIPNGVAANEFGSQRKGDPDFKRRLGLAVDKVTVLFSNRSFRDPIKGFPSIAEALNSRPWTELQVILIGGESAWATSQLPPNLDVVDVGYISDRKRLADFHEAADIFLYASDGENLPCAVLEAMSAECCVVATPVDGVTELVQDKQSGLLAESVAGSAITTVLAEALEMGYHERRVLGRNARKRMISNFSEQVMLNSYFSLYEQLISKVKERAD